MDYLDHSSWQLWIYGEFRLWGFSVLAFEIFGSFGTFCVLRWDNSLGSELPDQLPNVLRGVRARESAQQSQLEKHRGPFHQA